MSNKNQTPQPGAVEAPIIEIVDQLVGNLFMKLNRMPIVAEILTPDQMPECDSQLVYSAMFRLFTQGQNTVADLRAEMARQNMLGHLAKLQEKFSFAGEETMKEWCDEIVNYDEVRTITMRVEAVRQMASQPGARSSEILPHMTKIEFTSQREGFRHISEYGEEVLADLDRWQSGAMDGLSTGFGALDQYFRLAPGEYILACGRPGSGKTAFGLEVLRRNAVRSLMMNEPGIYPIFSAEMSGKALHLRCSASWAGINSYRLKTNQADADEWQRIRTAVREINKLPISIDQTPTPTPEQMYYKLLMLKSIAPIRGVLFDFVELGGVDDKSKKQILNEELRISMIARSQKDLAKEFNCPFIGLSQLSRAVESRADKLPQLSDLRYSGMLEQVADVVVGLMRPGYYLQRQQMCHVDPALFGTGYSGKTEAEKARSVLDNYPHIRMVAHANVLKQRNGAIGPAHLAFVEKYTRFAELDTRNFTVLPFDAAAMN